MRVLVGYASAKGSTREIAERIATRLRAAGHLTAVDSVDQASAIASYDALVSAVPFTTDSGYPRPWRR